MNKETEGKNKVLSPSPGSRPQDRREQPGGHWKKKTASDFHRRSDPSEHVEQREAAIRSRSAKSGWTNPARYTTMRGKYSPQLARTFAEK
eukprot:306915-Hanusia_phi.AAC.5